jgi:hypothetical protein
MAPKMVSEGLVVINTSVLGLGRKQIQARHKNVVKKSLLGKEFSITE